LDKDRYLECDLFMAGVHRIEKRRGQCARGGAEPFPSAGSEWQKKNWH